MENKFFTFTTPISEEELIRTAKNAIAKHFDFPSSLTSPNLVRDYLTLELANKEIEMFYMLFLNTKHQLIKRKTLFYGTIDSANVYQREVIRDVLKYNAAAVILAHNHPSGNVEPSAADRAITSRLKETLALIDVRLLDHLIVGGDSVLSFAERGLL